MRKTYTIQVPQAPTAHTSDLIGSTISTARPLTVKLSAADSLHTYKLAIADKTTQCTQQSAALSCDVAKLDLSQGVDYTAALYRSFKSKNEKLAEGKVTTLQPLKLTNGSLTNNQTVYDKPKEFSFSFDRPVTSVQVSLVKVIGETSEKIKTTPHKEGAVVKIQFDDLAREATYKLDLTEVIADNGSSLEDPVTYAFTTSGGPKVTSVSTGNTLVDRAASIVVKFDQPLDASVDLAKVARIEGVSGSVRRQSDTELVYAIQGGDCTPFSLVLDKGVKSGSNGEVSKDAWKFDARTICGTSWSIGSSVKGRAIVAYSFGSGASTVLFTGGMHGSEPSGYATMMAWVQYLQANAASTIPAGKRVVIVPNTNPDGIAVGSRNNSQNVNIDRNFPTANWSASIETTSGTLSTGGGTSAGSEPETAALMALTRQLRPRLEVSFHAQGRLVGANKFADSVAIGNIYSGTVGYQTMYDNAEAVMGYPMTGEYEDWMGESMNIPAILIELPTSSGNYLNSQLVALKKMLAV
jgi:protein MpaA